MNEELQQALAAILNKTTEATGQAASFLESELPEVIQQLLMWKLAESIIFCMLAVGWLVFVLRLAWRISKVIKHDMEGVPFIGMGAVMVALPGILNLNILWLQIWLAPKVYLIEYAAELAK